MKYPKKFKLNDYVYTRYDDDLWIYQITKNDKVVDYLSVDEYNELLSNHIDSVIWM